MDKLRTLASQPPAPGVVGHPDRSAVAGQCPGQYLGGQPATLPEDPSEGTEGRQDPTQRVTVGWTSLWVSLRCCAKHLLGASTGGA